LFYDLTFYFISCIKMKNKIHHTVGIIPKSNIKTVERGQIKTTNTSTWALTILAWYGHVNKTCFRVSSQVSSEWYKLRNKLINADFWNSQINLVRYLPIYVSCLGWLVYLIRTAQPTDAISRWVYLSRGKLGGLACNYKIIYWRFPRRVMIFNVHF
jgi:hypothetical protein